MSKIKSISLITILYVALIIILKRIQLPIENISLPEEMNTNKLPFVIIISILFIVLLSKLFKKKLNIWSILEMSGVLILIIPLNLIIISKIDYQKIDYLLSSKVKNFSEKNYNDGHWKITEFISEKDTIYKKQNPNWVKIYNGKYNLYKSNFHNYLYLTKTTNE